jgi:hypothetical protein
MEINFWHLPCPSRGVSLSHAHSEKCQTDHGGVHSVGTCCHCGHSPTSFAQSQFMTRIGAAPLPSVPSPDHQYIFTITGRCARAGCGKTRDEHPLLLAGEPIDGCPVDHKSVSGVVLPTDDGLERSMCSACGVMVEHRAVTGDGPAGPGYDKGRGEITPRQSKRLEFIQYMAKSNGDIPA